MWSVTPREKKAGVPSELACIILCDSGTAALGSTSCGEAEGKDDHTRPVVYELDGKFISFVQHSLRPDGTWEPARTSLRGRVSGLDGDVDELQVDFEHGPFRGKRMARTSRLCDTTRLTEVLRRVPAGCRAVFNRVMGWLDCRDFAFASGCGVAPPITGCDSLARLAAEMETAYLGKPRYGTPPDTRLALAKNALAVAAWAQAGARWDDFPDLTTKIQRTKPPNDADDF